MFQRGDDTPVTVTRRLKAYETQTEPVLEYFRWVTHTQTHAHMPYTAGKPSYPHNL